MDDKTRIIVLCGLPLITLIITCVSFGVAYFIGYAHGHVSHTLRTMEAQRQQDRRTRQQDIRERWTKRNNNPRHALRMTNAPTMDGAETLVLQRVSEEAMADSVGIGVSQQN